jgi:hypothetical protein
MGDSPQSVDDDLTPRRLHARERPRLPPSAAVRARNTPALRARSTRTATSPATGSAIRSGCPPSRTPTSASTSAPTTCATPTPHGCWPAERIFRSSRSGWATPTSPPRRSIRTPCRTPTSPRLRLLPEHGTFRRGRREPNPSSVLGSPPVPDIWVSARLIGSRFVEPHRARIRVPGRKTLVLRDVSGPSLT